MDLIRMKNVKKTYHNGVTALYDMSRSESTPNNNRHTPK